MSRARAQSAKRKTQRVMFGLQPEHNSTKFKDKRMQIIGIKPPKKKGRKSAAFKLREKWLKSIKIHIGKQKIIWHKA